MRSQRIGFLSGLAVATLASACGSITGTLPNDGGGGHAGSGGQGGGGQDGGAAACRTLDEAACRARTDCSVAGCTGCDGAFGFAYCFDPTHELPLECPASTVFCPSPCSSITDETTCRGRTDCQVLSCADCNGGTRFVGCGLPGAGAACPAILCPLPCAQVTTKDGCEARTDCHSVFVDPHNCACAALGCCAQFSRCADGDKAACQAPSGLVCGAAPPYCEGPYVVGYTTGCYEGCVQKTDCQIN